MKLRRVVRLGLALRLGDGDQPVARVHDPHPERGADSVPVQPRGAVRRCGGDAAIRDPGGAELSVGEQGVVGPEQPLVTAPVLVEGPLRLHDLLCVEVRVDVRSPEGVDRLLGVTDQHEGRTALTEGAVHDVPLHRVGVLELVDEHDVVALAQAGAGSPSPFRVEERVPQPQQDVVVREDLQVPFPARHLLAHGVGEPASNGGRVGGIGPRRDEVGVRVVEHLLGDLQGLRPGEAERVRTGGELPQIEVVDHLLPQVADVLDQFDFPVDVAGGPQAVQHLQAEAVGRLDGGCVEVRDGLAEPVPARFGLVAGRVGQEPHDLVVFVAGRPGQDVHQAVVGGDETVAHALAQFSRGHPGERDDQEAVDRRPALGDVARGQRGDREGLPGSGTRLEQGHATGQRPTDLERLRVELRRGGERHRAVRHRSTTTSRARRPAHRRHA